MVLRYFEGVKVANLKHHRAMSGAPEVLEHRQRLSLRTEGNNDLDPRLAEVPIVRRLIVSNLTTFVWLLSTKIRVSLSELWRILIEYIHRVVEQASAFRFVLSVIRNPWWTSRTKATHSTPTPPICFDIHLRPICFVSTIATRVSFDRE